MTQTSAGARFRAALAEEQPLQIVGAINANHALMARRPTSASTHSTTC
jgi:methylisocitrate lyase